MNNGLTDCRPEEQWSKVFLDFNKYTEEGSMQYGGRLSMSCPFNLDEPTFTIDLRDSSRLEDVSNKACECFLKHNIQRRVYFIVSESKKTNDKWIETPIREFYCDNGKMVITK